jgi:hypothetical protein
MRRRWCAPKSCRPRCGSSCADRAWFTSGFPVCEVRLGVTSRRHSPRLAARPEVVDCSKESMGMVDVELARDDLREIKNAAVSQSGIPNISERMTYR